MVLTIQPATQADIPTLIDIFFTAFANDKLLMTCYPDTAANRAFWVRSVQSQMQHEGSLVFKAVSGDKDGTENIVGWAKWLANRGAPTKDNEEKEKRQGALDPEDEPSPDMDMDACRKLADGQYSMLEEILAGRGYYWLNAIAVHPSFHRQGAATMLVGAGTELADRDRLECFSACTTQANENMKNVLKGAGFDVFAERPVVKGLSVFGGYRKAKIEAE